MDCRAIAVTLLAMMLLAGLTTGIAAAADGNGTDTDDGGYTAADDRDGDGVVDDKDAYPDDPERWHAESEKDSEDDGSDAMFFYPIMGMLGIIIILLVVLILRKGRTESDLKKETPEEEVEWIPPGRERTGDRRRRRSDSHHEGTSRKSGKGRGKKRDKDRQHKRGRRSGREKEGDKDRDKDGDGGDSGIDVELEWLGDLGEEEELAEGEYSSKGSNAKEEYMKRRVEKRQVPVRMKGAPKPKEDEPKLVMRPREKGSGKGGVKVGEKGGGGDPKKRSEIKVRWFGKKDDGDDGKKKGPRDVDPELDDVFGDFR